MAHRILIVEDDSKNMKLVRHLLRASGYETLEACDGAEGVEAARTGKPALILMDVQMPVMNGLDATRTIKADPETRHIPVVALTALAMEGDRKRTEEAGCDGYITKPIRMRSFLDALKQYLPDD